MNRIRVVALAFVAAFAVSAIAVASASAAPPEYGRCVAKAGGKFSDAGCTKAAVKKGKFEWLSGPGPKSHFVSSEGLTTLETVGKAKITCKSDTDSGEIIGSKEDRETIVFTGCETNGLKCHSAGDAEGEITTTPLRSELGFIKAPKTVGVSLESLTGPFAELECGPLKIAISGSVIAPTTAVNKMSTIFKESFTASKGKQKPESFEGAPKDTLTCNVLGKPEQCGLTSADTITQEERLEINTTAMPESAKWWVEGKLLEGEEAIAEETTIPPAEPFKLKLEGKEVGSFTIVCKGIKIKHGRIEAPGARSEEAVVFEKCEVEGKPECVVANTESKHLNAQLEGVPSAIKLKFEPTSGSEIVAYHVTGTAACKVQGFYRANGTMDCNYNGVETESAEHSLEFTETSGSKVEVKTPSNIKVPAGFTVTDKVHLTSGKQWSAFF